VKRSAPRLLIAAFGLPGGFSAWGFNAVTALARAASGDVLHIHADSRDEFSRAGVGDPARPIVLTSQYPDHALTDYVLELDLPAIVFTEDAADALRHLSQSAPQPQVALLRALSASAACLFPLYARSNIAIINRDAFREVQVLTMLVRMARHFRLDLAPDVFARTLRPLYVVPGGAGGMTLATIGEQVSGQIPHGNSVTDSGVDAIFGGQQQLAVVGAPPRSDASPSVIWQQSLFTAGDPPNQTGVETIALAGAARCLLYGPYLHLPRGLWTARIILDFDHAACMQSFVLEFHAGEAALARVRFAAPAAGRFAAVMALAVAEPRNPIELRLFLECGAIEGTISLLRVEFFAVGDTASDMRAAAS
jgi:hypothetical protein